MTLSARDVAAELRRRLPGVGAKKLHKLLYYCQGHHVAALGSPLFSEVISAWDMGPVVGKLWYDERQGGESPATAGLDESQLNTVGYVLSRYGALTGADLEHLTHGEAPWQEADGRRTPGTSARIELSAIASYFRLASDDESDSDTPLPDVAAVSDWLKDAAARRAEVARPDNVDELLARLAPSA